jgi:uncharacterized protein
MTPYWPSWLVAGALGVLTVGYWIALRRPLGVAGVLARFSRLREEAEFDRGAAVLQADQAALEAAMAALTAEAFGPLAMEPAGEAQAAAPAVATEWPAAAPASAEPSTGGRICAPTPPLSAHLIFLAGLVAGGLATSVGRGTFGAGMGAAFAAHFASGSAGLGALLGGGVLVGFGTSLCGGCSAGHGLTGCGRLMPGSLVATAVFFASAAGASIVLGRLP